MGSFSFIMNRLIRGKTLIFVNEINSCYKLKLFLEQFGIRSCVLNSELPYNSRSIEYNILISLFFLV